MKILKIIIFLLVLISSPVAAEDIVMSWINATQNVDGTPIPTDLTDPSSLASTVIMWGSCLIGDIPDLPILEQTVPTTVPGLAESTVINIVTPGRYCFMAFHINKKGLLSDLSTPTIRIVANTPAPPNNLIVQDMVVFYVIQQPGTFILLPIGTVPAGTVCDSTQSVNGFFSVPVDEVTWTGTVRPLVVVAQCG